MNNISELLVPALQSLPEDLAVAEKVSGWVESIDGRLRWEVGSLGGEMYFAFSPNRYVELLQVSEALAASMPRVAGWQFLGSKPRKTWEVRKVSIAGNEYFFDDWRYQLIMFKGGEFFDIKFYAPVKVEGPDIAAKLGIFLAMSELGERFYMRAVDRVEVLSACDLDGPSVKIENLFDQMQELYTGEA